MSGGREIDDVLMVKRVKKNEIWAKLEQFLFSFIILHKKKRNSIYTWREMENCVNLISFHFILIIFWILSVSRWKSELTSLKRKNIIFHVHIIIEGWSNTIIMNRRREKSEKNVLFSSLEVVVLFTIQLRKHKARANEGERKLFSSFLWLFPASLCAVHRKTIFKCFSLSLTFFYFRMICENTEWKKKHNHKVSEIAMGTFISSAHFQIKNWNFIDFHLLPYFHFPNCRKNFPSI